MGTATAPVRGSGSWPAGTARVAKPRFLGAPFICRPRNVGAPLRERRAFYKIAADERAVLADAMGGAGAPPPRPDASPSRGGVDGLQDSRAGGGCDPPPRRARRPCDRRRRGLRPGARPAYGARSREARRALRRSLAAAGEHPADGGQPALGAGAGTRSLPRKRAARTGGGHVRAAGL